MSETVGYKGKLEVVDVDVMDTLEEALEKIFIERSAYKEDCYDTYLEALDDEDDLADYIVVDETIYRYVEKHKFNYESIIEASENEDGTIDFICVFYNGGTGLKECVEEAISEL